MSFCQAEIALSQEVRVSIVQGPVQHFSCGVLTPKAPSGSHLESYLYSLLNYIQNFYQSECWGQVLKEKASIKSAHYKYV